MAADVKLEGNNVHTEGTLIVNGPDIMLDERGRRRGPKQYRRALVHGFTDELVLNFDDDYPNGVLVHGAVRLHALSARPAPKPQPTEADATEMTTGVKPKLPDLSRMGSPRDFMVQRPLDISTMFDKVEDPVDLIREIRRLRSALVELDRRVKELEGAAAPKA